MARVDGKARLVEGLAMPHEEDEFVLSYYNTMTTWISIDRLLDVFGLTRSQLGQPELVTAAIRQLSQRMPTYVTLKEVKKRAYFTKPSVKKRLKKIKAVRRLQRTLMEEM